MGFRDNLQHLRATRSMTQEELAMLLGVSRQAVSKWEAERAYPEMDKLQKLCALFDCTLDELVTGDLTARPPVAALAVREDVPAADVFGYNHHMVRRALMTSAGVGAVGLGVAAGLGTGTEQLVPLFALAGAAVGLTLLAVAARSHALFAQRHPFIEDFYAEADRARVGSLRRVGVAALLVAVLLGVVAFFVEIGPLQHVAGGVGSLVAAVSLGVWAFVLCWMLAARMNIGRYNRRWGDRDDIEDRSDAEKRELAVQGEVCSEADEPAPSARRGVPSARAAAGIFALAVVSATGLIALVAFRSPLSWYAWVVMVLLCVAVWIALRAAHEARRA